MKYGIIDIGSNTIRVVVYKITDDGFECIFNKKQFVQLIDYVNNGRMRDEGKRNMLFAVKQLAEAAAHFRPERIDCFATAPFRAVQAHGELSDMIKTFTGLNAVVLSGEEEARLQMTGARFIHGTDDGLFVDLGGGSLEAGLMTGGRIAHAQSIDIGCVNLSSRFVSGFFPSKQELKKLKSYIDKKLSEMNWLSEAQGQSLICTGGTARALGEIHKTLYGSSVPVDSYGIDAKELKQTYETLMDMDIEGVRLIAKHASGRIFTFVPGVVALWRLAKAAKVNQVQFSTYGVREGYLINNILMTRPHAGVVKQARNRSETDGGYGKEDVV
jgi:exopolyphosphatase/guanosine-5'-triphosphate,3'-diphosphate pyrophosphatase